MRALPTLLILLLCLGAVPARGREFHVGQQPVLITNCFAFTEGPVVDARGYVYFSDIPNQRIHRWSPRDVAVTNPPPPRTP